MSVSSHSTEEGGEEDINTCASYDESLDTLYISNTSTSDSPCTYANPCQSMGAAADGLESDGVIVLLPGIHTHATQVYRSNITLTVVSSSCSADDTFIAVESLTDSLFYLDSSSNSETKLNLHSFSIAVSNELTTYGCLFYISKICVLSLESMKLYGSSPSVSVSASLTSI